MKKIKIVLLSSFFLMTLAITPSVLAKEYFIYGDKKNGTKFRERLLAWNVPLKKSYSRLSDKYKMIVRSDYPMMNEGDSPPYPTKGMIKILKPFVKEFRWYGDFSAGTVFANINADGRVIGIYGSPQMHAIIIDYMRRQLRTIQFDPGTCSGVPCAQTFILKLNAITNQKREHYL